jgi:hypothetical protein
MLVRFRHFTPMEGYGCKGCGKTHSGLQEVSGHDFSRAVNATKKRWALALEGIQSTSIGYILRGVLVNQSNPMSKELESSQPPPADEIAELADRGEDISRYFTRKGKMMPPFAPDAKEEGDGQEN